MRIYKAENLIKEGKSIGIFKLTSDDEVALHSHEFIEIVYVNGGNAVERVDETRYPVKRGDIIFINYDSIHSFFNCENFSYYNISFSPEALGDKTITEDNALVMLTLSTFNAMRKNKAGGKISLNVREREEIELILKAMLNEQENDLPLSGKVMENYLDVILIKLLRKTEDIEGANIIKDAWEELRDYIDKNPTEELTLSSLSKKTFYNPSYFSRTFKQKFGRSLTDYVTERRIETAKQLLDGTRLSVEAIAEKSGFSDKSAFYNAFFKHTGTTPAKYRKTEK